MIFGGLAKLVRNCFLELFQEFYARDMLLK